MYDLYPVSLSARNEYVNFNLDDTIGKLKVVALLESLPGVGKVKARAIMAEVGISETRRVRGLGPHQAKALVDRFG